MFVLSSSDSRQYEFTTMTKKHIKGKKERKVKIKNKNTVIFQEAIL